MKQQLSERARVFLHQPNLAVLSTLNEDGLPHQTGMWYLLEKDEHGADIIIMNTVRSRKKAQNIQLSQWVSLCVTSRNTIYHYVTIGGHARIIDTPDIARADILRLATHYDGTSAAQWFFETVCIHQERVSISIQVEEVYEYWGVDNRQLIEANPDVV